MPLAFGPTIVEGKVYRGKKKPEEDEETQALREIQSILSNKNRRQCDCEAQIHDLLENCLNCGRLTCESEGPGKCFYCGSIVLSRDQRNRLQRHVDVFQTIPTPSSSQPSISTKLNNTFDHFSIDKLRHLGEEERNKLRDHLDELESKKNKRKLMLDVDVENAEVRLRSEPLIEDYEDRLKRLQLSHEPTEADSNLILPELVAAESRKRYNPTYVIARVDKSQSKSSSYAKPSKSEDSNDKTRKRKNKRQRDKKKKPTNEVEANSRVSTNDNDNYSKKQNTGSRNVTDAKLAKKSNSKSRPEADNG